ncbi:homeobox protein EMX1 isoform X3 [Poecile atricapillus]|uniref:homeobox protein EMX1 isoform X3 n=1 Tax=Poecile atricapillus TaxID=48891 RepID=UPI00273933A5|nr:homeobox protein EMX1 isoform X3 [Poecile atricapillus]
MFQPSAKRCFTIESLVGKDTPLGPEDPPRPAALAYPGPAAAADAAAFAPGFQGAAGRALYGSAELVFPEAVGHPALPVGPPQLGGSALPHPHPFFGPQHRDPLNFYPWVLRNRFFGHRFQGESVVPEPADEIQTAEAGGGGPRLGAEEEGLAPHQPMAPRHQAVERRRHRRHLQRLKQGQAPGAATMERTPGQAWGTQAVAPTGL